MEKNDAELLFRHAVSRVEKNPGNMLQDADMGLTRLNRPVDKRIQTAT
jgi:hypothetical protein